MIANKNNLLRKKEAFRFDSAFFHESFSLWSGSISIIGLMVAVRTRFSFGKSFELIFNIIAWSIDTYTVGTHFVVLGNWRNSKTSNTSNLNNSKVQLFGALTCDVKFRLGNSITVISVGMPPNKPVDMYNFELSYFSRLIFYVV